MNRILVKNIIIFSLILGVILGIFSPIPVVGLIMLFGMLLLSAPITMVYLIMDSKLELTTPTNSIIFGALSGFCVNISFSVVYCIIIALLSQFTNYNPNLVLTAMVVNSPIWLIGVFIVFLGVLCATTNAFTGFGTFYIINLIRDIYEKQHSQDRDLK